MRVTYIWTEQEWREAVALSGSRAARRPTLPGLTWALVVLPLIGGAGELLINLRHAQKITVAGTIIPILLILLAVAVALGLLLATVVRRRKTATIRAGIPFGQWEAVLQESGWRFTGHPPGEEEAATATKPEPVANLLPAQIKQSLKPWSEFTDVRHGDRVMVLIHDGGFEALPTSSLTPEQGSHLYRLVTRKLRPSRLPT
jgi:hypothetical protein